MLSTLSTTRYLSTQFTDRRWLTLAHTDSPKTMPRRAPLPSPCQTSFVVCSFTYVPLPSFHFVSFRVLANLDNLVNRFVRACRCVHVPFLSSARSSFRPLPPLSTATTTTATTAATTTATTTTTTRVRHRLQEVPQHPLPFHWKVDNCHYNYCTPNANKHAVVVEYINHAKGTGGGACKFRCL